MVQCLRLHSSTAGDLGLIPGQGIKILHVTWKSPPTPQKKLTHSLLLDK